MQQQSPPEQFDLAGIAADLNSLLRLKTTVIGMKLFATVEEMEAIPKIRRPNAKLSPIQPCSHPGTNRAICRPSRFECQSIQTTRA